MNTLHDALQSLRAPSILVPLAETVARYERLSTPNALRCLTRYLDTRELPSPRPFSQTGRLLSIQARTVPIVALESVLAAQLLGVHLTLKLPAGTHNSLVDAILPLLPAPDRVTVLSSSRAEWPTDGFSAYDAVVCYGSDTTLQAVRAHVPSDLPFVAFGHRVSYAILSPTPKADFDIDRFAEGLATDLGMWDQRGCMAPQAVFVPSADVSRLCRALAEELLPLAEAVFPRGPLVPADRAALMQSRARVTFSGGEVVCGEGWDLHVYPQWMPQALYGPGARTLAVIPYEGWDDLRRMLSPLRRHLSTLSGVTRRDLVDRLGWGGGLIRRCEAGQMQFPVFQGGDDVSRLLGELGGCFT